MNQHKITISNINMSAKLTEKIDIQLLSQQWSQEQTTKTIHYSPLFRLIIKFETGVLIVYPGGSIIVLGKVVPEVAKLYICFLKTKISKMINKTIQFSKEPKLNSLIVDATLPYNIDFGSLLEKQPRSGRSGKEKNPGVYLCLNKFGVKKVLLFSTGKMKLCGPSSIQKLQQCYQYLKGHLHQYKRKF